MESRNLLNNLDKYIAIILVIGGAVFLRVIPHPPNIAPITALALFGGAYLSKKLAIFIPFLAMLIADSIIGFHDTMLYVYVSFMLITVFGLYLQKRKEAFYIMGASLVSSFFFFFITNLGVWAEGTMYTKDYSGLMSSYTMGLPFLRNTVLGDLFYTFGFFYGYQLLKIVSKSVIVRLQRNYIL